MYVCSVVVLLSNTCVEERADPCVAVHVMSKSQRAYLTYPPVGIPKTKSHIDGALSTCVRCYSWEVYQGVVLQIQTPWDSHCLLYIVKKFL